VLNNSDSIRKLQLTFTALDNFPLVKAGDDVADLIFHATRELSIELCDGDIFVITQKVVSKAEGRLVDLRSIEPSLIASLYAKLSGKSNRIVELILRESQEILRIRKGLIIARHNLGFVCANAGIDHSNSIGGAGSEHFVLLLPLNPDKSAETIQEKLYASSGKVFGIVIIDSHGRAWRNGTIGTTIGIANVPGIVDLRGKPDLYGYKLKTTFIAAADELAAGASLLMGQANEGRPCVHVSGFPYGLRESSVRELIRSRKKDLFK
jgi:coenzyme F420-0:L-glutamate ligase/coenzyme F420-1:gamma-L-glutamate ligase